MNISDTNAAACVLDVIDVSVNLRGQQLLEKINLRAYENEIVAIIGPNGAGKSSLLKAILQDFPIQQGRILLNQQTLSDQNRQAKQIASLPQFSLLNFPYSVEEVVGLARIPHETGTLVDQEIIKEVLSAMDISHLRGKTYTQLSGGEKQRVQLARVLAQIWRAQDTQTNTNRLLLLDEPTTALDLGHQQMLMQALTQFTLSNKHSNSKIAIVMVLHDINLAARYADKLVAMLDGKLLAYGNTREILTEEMVWELFEVKANIMTHPQHNTPFIVSQ